MSIRILVADDNVDAADTLREILGLVAQCEVKVVYGGREAIQAALSGEFTCAVIDIGMPGIGGREVATALRRFPKTKDMRLIALSGWGTDADIKKNLQAGFDVHLTKPVQHEALLAALKLQ